MSDFLARLALRATDTAAAVHPRPLGRFEPAAEPRAAISHDAGDAPASWPTPPRRPENAPAVAQPLAPLPRPRRHAPRRPVGRAALCRAPNAAHRRGRPLAAASHPARPPARAYTRTPAHPRAAGRRL